MSQGLPDLPVVAAPMAGGPSTAALVVAAGRAGSLGFVPAGYRTAAQLAETLREVRAGTESYGVNLFVPDPIPIDRAAVAAYRDLIAPEIAAAGAELGPERWADDDDWAAKIDLLVDDPAPWVSFTFGLPDAASARRLRRAGSRLMLTVTDAAEARAALELRPDALAVQAAAAGGHRGTFDQRREPDERPLTELIAAIASTTDVPLVAAGGVADPAGVRVALEAGATAVAVGTALLLADEAGTREVHRQAIQDPGAVSVTQRAYTGRVARGLRTAFTTAYDAAAPPGYPAIHHLTAPLRARAAAQGDREHVHLWAGTGHRLARSGPAAELLGALAP